MKTIVILVFLTVAGFIWYKGYQLIKKKTPNTNGGNGVNIGIGSGGNTIPNEGEIPTRDFPEELKQE